VEKNDGPELIAPRHGGQANALLGDGSVRPLDPEDVTDGMFTPQPGD
jgi:prepilin-type processing-associated H-X9-DG protein